MRNTMKLIGVFTIGIVVSFLFITCDNGSNSKSDPDIFTVIFNSNGGSAVPSQSVSDGGKATKPKGVSQQVNFGLEGWYTDNSTFENKWNFDVDTITGDITLYAKWQAVDPLDYEDFGPVLVTTTYTVANATHWINAVEAIKNGGDDKAYVINITGDFSIGGSQSPTFGNSNNIIVSIRSDSKTISLLPPNEYECRYLLYIGKDEGIMVENNQDLVLRNVNLQGNNLYGGSRLVGVYTGTFIMRGGEISGSSNEPCHGVDIKDGNFIMYNGKIFNNNGYGVEILEGSFVMHGGEISGNKFGGVNVNGSFIMHNGKIISNEHTGVSVDGSFTMHGGEISGNRYGGVYIKGTFIMHDGKIANNEESGAFIHGNFTMNDGEISGNEGSGADMDWNSTFILNNGIIKENHEVGVNFFVGGICSFTMNGGIISNNIGGGVYIRNNYSDNYIFTMNEGSIKDNGNVDSWGGGIHIEGTKDFNFIMNGGTISGNTAKYGGGVCAVNFTMTGGIISGNTAITGGGGVYIYANFTKHGGIIYGNNEGVNSNTVSEGISFVDGNVIFGHAVFRQNLNDYYLFRDTTLGENDNISTSSELPQNAGETLNGWTRK